MSGIDSFSQSELSPSSGGGDHRSCRDCPAAVPGDHSSTATTSHCLTAKHNAGNLASRDIRIQNKTCNNDNDDDDCNNNSNDNYNDDNND